MNQALLNAQKQLHQQRQSNGNGRTSSTPFPIATLVQTAVKAPAPASESTPPAVTAERVTLAQLDPKHHPMVEKAIKAAREWAKRKMAGEGNASLVLVASQVNKPDGTPDINRTGYGCGKTHIAKAILWSIAYTVDDSPIAPAGKFFEANRLIQALDAETTARDELHGAPIVVIDDVGTEQQIPYIGNDQRQVVERQARYFKVIDYAYKNGVSLVLTGNMTIDELAAHVGGRAWSRLLQMAPKGFMLDLTGVPDYRRKASGR